MPASSSASSSKALAAILPQIASGQAYEAHQKARTFASRYVKSSQYDTAIEVLFQSARELLKAGQLGSGTDLAVFLVDVYESKGEEVTDESRGRLTQLIALIGPSGSWRKTLTDKAIAWSAKHGPCPSGDQALHHYYGELLYKEGSYDTAETHFLASGGRDSARLLAQMMCQWWQATSSTSSPAAFALRGTLPFLLNGNVLGARSFITLFVSSSIGANPKLRSTLQANPVAVPGSGAATGDEIIFTTEPVLNYLQLAVRTCQRAQGDQNKAVREAWVRLCGTYMSKGGILAQAEVRKYVNEIAMLFFALSPPRGQAASPFGDIMSSLFGGGTGAASAPRVLMPASATAPGLD